MGWVLLDPGLPRLQSLQPKAQKTTPWKTQIKIGLNPFNPGSVGLNWFNPSSVHLNWFNPGSVGLNRFNPGSVDLNWFSSGSVGLNGLIQITLTSAGGFDRRNWVVSSRTGRNSKTKRSRVSSGSGLKTLNHQLVQVFDWNPELLLWFYFRTCQYQDLSVDGVQVCRVFLQLLQLIRHAVLEPLQQQQPEDERSMLTSHQVTSDLPHPPAQAGKTWSLRSVESHIVW